MGRIPWNKVKKVKIPERIMDNQRLLKNYTRGIADTNFTLIFAKKHTEKNFYPRITAGFASKKLVESLEEALRGTDFTLNTSYNSKSKDNKRNKVWITNRIHLDGPHNLDRWIKEIGFSNLRIISRLELWRKEGQLKPKTTLPERLKKLGWVGGGWYGRDYSYN
jgi:hypothetical protein